MDYRVWFHRFDDFQMGAPLIRCRSDISFSHFKTARISHRVLVWLTLERHDLVFIFCELLEQKPRRHRTPQLVFNAIASQNRFSKECLSTGNSIHTANFIGNFKAILS